MGASAASREARRSEGGKVNRGVTPTSGQSGYRSLVRRTGAQQSGCGSRDMPGRYAVAVKHHSCHKSWATPEVVSHTLESTQGHERCSSPTRSRCRESRDYSAPAEVASGTHFRRAVRSGRIGTPREAGEAVGIATPTSGDPAFVAVMK